MPTKKSPAQLQREIDETLAKKSTSKPADMFIPTNPGKYIADYIRKDDGHLAVELRSACQGPQKTRERDLREIAWAAVDNINHAWEGRLGLVTRGDITDAVEHLQRWCAKQGTAKRAVSASTRRSQSKSHSTVKCPSPDHPLYPELRRIRQVAHDTSWAASQLAQDAERAFRNGDCEKAEKALEAAKRVIAKERRKRR